MKMRRKNMITLTEPLPANTGKMAVSKYHATEEQLSAEMEEIAAAKKNPARFEPLYTRYYEQIFRYIYQRMNDQEQAFDVTAQVFLKALTNIQRYEFRGVPFSSWLYRIALSETNRAFRANSAQRTVNIEKVQVHSLLEEMDDSADERSHQLEAAIAAINTLEENDLQLIEMRFFEKRAFREIAEILDITENNAKVKTYRILDKIKKQIAANR